MADIPKLAELTKELLHYLKETDEIFQEVKRKGEKRNFYTEVKPYCDRLHGIVSRWKDLAAEWQQEAKPKNIFPVQIENTAENFNTIAVQAFYPETSYKRFKHHVSSIHYILEKMLAELEGGSADEKSPPSA